MIRREKCPERLKVEQVLAHVAARKGPRAKSIRYRRNLFDLRRAAVLQNLEAMQRELPLAVRITPKIKTIDVLPLRPELAVNGRKTLLVERSHRSLAIAPQAPGFQGT